jgi:hypothetical protein
MQRISLIVYLVLGLGLAASAADFFLHPLQQRSQWKFEDPAAWEWQGDGEATVLVLRKPSHYKPVVRRPINMAWFEGAEWDSFTLTCEARLDVFNKGNNDLCIAFAGVSEQEFYYAHLGESADSVHLQMHVVNRADRKPITTQRVDTLPWQPNHWHQIKLVHDSVAGKMKVWFDDQLVLEAADKSFRKGRIGFGSFDDLGAFRNIIITPAISAATRDSFLRMNIVARRAESWDPRAALSVDSGLPMNSLPRLPCVQQ